MYKLNIKQVSDLMGLSKNQSLHAFANFVIDGPDNELFIDPLQMTLNQDTFSKEAYATFEDFLKTVTDILAEDPLNEIKLKSLFKYSFENNSTRMGTSKVIPNSYSKGNGCTPEMLYKLFTTDDAIKLARKGVFNSSISNIHLFIKGFDRDRMTDLISSVIFHLLVNFTEQQMAKSKKKVLQSPLPLKYMFWNRHSHQWEEKTYYPYLDFNKKPITLVPKNILTGYYVYNAERYMRGHILLSLQQKLYKQDKSTDPKAKKIKLDDLEKLHRESLGLNAASYKEMIVEYTLQQPNLQMLEDFKNLDRYSNTFSYSGKLSDDQLTTLILKPYKSLEMID